MIIDRNRTGDKDILILFGMNEQILSGNMTLQSRVLSMPTNQQQNCRISRTNLAAQWRIASQSIIPSFVLSQPQHRRRLLTALPIHRTSTRSDADWFWVTDADGNDSSEYSNCQPLQIFHWILL
jgi:hypothetical protein